VGGIYGKVQARLETRTHCTSPVGNRRQNFFLQEKNQPFNPKPTINNHQLTITNYSAIKQFSHSPTNLQQSTTTNHQPKNNQQNHYIGIET